MLVRAPALAMRTSRRPNRSSVACTLGVSYYISGNSEYERPRDRCTYRGGSLIESLLRTPHNGHVCTGLCVGNSGFLSDAPRCASDEYNFAAVCLVCESFFRVNRWVHAAERVSGI